MVSKPKRVRFASLAASLHDVNFSCHGISVFSALLAEAVGGVLIMMIALERCTFFATMTNLRQRGGLNYKRHHGSNERRAGKSTDLTCDDAATRLATRFPILSTLGQKRPGPLKVEAKWKHSKSWHQFSFQPLPPSLTLAVIGSPYIPPPP